MSSANEINPGLPDSPIPAADSAEAHFLRQASTSHSIALMEESATLGADELESQRLIHRGNPIRKYTDIFREIRTRLLESTGARNFITLVVSASPGSGASFVARNLAAAFALDEAKTSLLVDCNLRHPAQHIALGVDLVNGGLSDFLDHPSMGLASVLYQTGIKRLRLLPAGNARENRSEYFTSFRMRGVLDSLRSRYPDRYILLDGPTIKGSPDARILSDLADYVLIVAGYGRDTPKAISQAVANFDPAKLAGVVFNHAP
ncbi:polysaccharide biosynthesis protein [Metallibacterium sp.]|uniref:polysaccharide biosynthesis protein n=1 Tax=Metallibacterium sp. TaxID=2940281 RepID=UPI0026153577|nr:polysaccharide biosynthesis protein [Metallibacterium sp.]